eukprot:88364_1
MLNSVMIRSAILMVLLSMELVTASTEPTIVDKCPEPVQAPEPVPCTCTCNNLCLFEMLYNQQHFHHDGVYMEPCTQSRIRHICRTLCTNFAADQSGSTPKSAAILYNDDLDIPTQIGVNALASLMKKNIDIYCFAIVTQEVEEPLGTKKCGEEGKYKLCLADVKSKKSLDISFKSLIEHPHQSIKLTDTCDVEAHLMCVSGDPSALTFVDCRPGDAPKKKVVAAPIKPVNHQGTNDDITTVGNDNKPTFVVPGSSQSAPFVGANSPVYGFIKSPDW